MRRATVLAIALLGCSTPAAAQISHRGFVEARGLAFPQEAPNDRTQLAGDLLAREEVFATPWSWLDLAAGVDVRAGSQGQVEDEWRVDFGDRGVRRPRIGVRRLGATVSSGPLTIDAGKQFIRWGRTDILNPTDRFAPRDYLEVIESPFLPVLAVRPVLELGAERMEFVLVPRFTPSRMPLFDRRWTALPPEAAGVTLRDGGASLPDGPQYGVRWNHTGQLLEGSVSYFDGVNHLPRVDARPLPDVSVQLTRVYSGLRSVGGDIAVPLPWVTVKGEAAVLMSPDEEQEEYVIYVLEMERQVGEWSLIGGYIGEAVTKRGAAFRFAPDRGTARSIIGRASYTVDPRRTVAIEGALRENVDGVYVKGEYSEAIAQHWRLTVAGVALAGDQADFLGQYRRNSHGSVAVRYSF